MSCQQAKSVFDDNGYTIGKSEFLVNPTKNTFHDGYLQFG